MPSHRGLDTLRPMDFRPTDEQELLRRTVREFAEAEMRPHVMEWDEAQHFPMELLPKLAALGLTGIQFAEEFGGSGMSAVDYCICIEELARVCPAIALSVAAHNGLCTSHIATLPRRTEAEVHAASVARDVLGAWGRPKPWRAATRRDADDGMRDRTNGSKARKTFSARLIGGVMSGRAITDRRKGNRAFPPQRRALHRRMRAAGEGDKLDMRAGDPSEVSRGLSHPRAQLSGRRRAGVHQHVRHR